MYARFYRWAFDRLDENGIVAFITNRSFIDSKTFDGFRRCVYNDFDYAYIIDTKSDVRQNPKIAGTTHNVFGIQTGVALMFLVRKEKRDNTKCLIRYISMDDFWRKEEKLAWLSSNPLKQITFETVQPDKNNNWINISDNDWDELLPLALKETKHSKRGSDEQAVFKNYSLGIATNRDEWVYDWNEENLIKKIKYFCKVYTNEMDRWRKTRKKQPINDFVDREIKWTSELEEHLITWNRTLIEEKMIRRCDYRPYTSMFLYFLSVIVHRMYQQEIFFRMGTEIRITLSVF